MIDVEVAAPSSPYKGLAPFNDSSIDALFFFGRERETEIISANLLAYRLTVLYGASGVGKSSLLGAGVAYNLRKRGEPLVVFSRWNDDPVADLLTELHVALPGANEEDGLAATLGGWTSDHGRDVYLILDQFDEYFVYHEGGHRFAKELAEIANRSDLRVNVLIAIRDDMLSRLDRFKALIPNMFSNYLRLDHLDRRAAREAIVGPLERYNALVPPAESVSIEPELVETILDQIAGDSGLVEAPYLQVVLQRLWDEEREAGSRVLRLKTLDRLGGAEEIVRSNLVDALEALPRNDRDIASELFNHLVTPSGTKIAHRVGDLAQYAAVSERDVSPVLDALVGHRIVRPINESGALNGGARYEIFHDVLAEPVVAWRAQHEAERELERTRTEAQRRHRRLLGLTVAALLAVAVMVGVTLFALTERSNARSQARRSHARELAAKALTGIDANPQRSLQLAVQAAHLSDRPEIEDVLREVLVEAHERAVLPQQGVVHGASFVPDASAIAVGSDRGVRLYSTSGRRLAQIATPDRVTAFALDPSGRFLVAASSGHELLFVDAKTRRRLRRIRLPGTVTSVAIAGGRVVTAGPGAPARAWRLDGRPVASFRGSGAVTDVDVSHDGMLAVTVGKDRLGHSQARIFDVRSGRLLHVLPQLGVITAAFNPPGGIVATGSADRTAQLWNARSGRRLDRPLQHAGHVVDLEFSSDGRWLATASEDGLGRIWDVGTASTAFVLPGATQPITSIDFDRRAQFVVTGSLDGNAYVYRTTDGLLLAVLAGHRAAIRSVAFSPEARRVVTTSDDGTVRIWDPEAADQLRLVRRVNRPVTAAFTPDGRIVVRPLPTGPPTARSPRGDLLARARGSEVVLADTRTGATLHSLSHGARVTDVEFSPDGSRLATTSWDGKGRIWDVRSGRLLHELVGHFGHVEAASFSPDGRWIVTAGPRAALLWRTTTGRPLVPGFYLRGHALTYRGRPAHMTSARFSSDGRRIVTASLDRTVRVYDCEVCGDLPALVASAEERLAKLSPRARS